MTQGMVAIEEVVVVVEEEEGAAWGRLNMLGVELRGRLNVKAGRRRLAMLWDCMGCPA